MDIIHGIHPLSLVLSRHTNVSFVGNVIERLFEEIEINALSLLLSDEEL